MFEPQARTEVVAPQGVVERCLNNTGVTRSAIVPRIPS